MELLSQQATLPVSSPLRCFTAVCGMGTGGATAHHTPGPHVLVFGLGTMQREVSGLIGVELVGAARRGTYRCEPSALSTAWLHALPRFHRRPIYQVIFLGPYSLDAMGNLILASASRLDAFSAYPNRS